MYRSSTYFLLILVGSLSLILYKSDAGTLSKTISSQCNQECPEVMDQSLPVGKTFVYDYEGSTLSQVKGLTQELSGLRIKAKVIVRVQSTCEMLVSISNVAVDERENGKDYQISEDSEQYAKYLNDRVMHLHVINGKIERACKHDSDPEWVINILKGIVSTLNVYNVPVESQQSFIETNDISGKCLANVTMSSDGVITMQKRMQTCQGRVTMESSLQGSQYTTSPYKSYQSLPITEDKHVCYLKLTSDRSMIESADCSESYLVRPLSSNENGIVTEIHQSLKLKETMNELLGSYIGKRFILTKLTYQSDREEIKRIESENMKSAVKSLKTLCDTARIDVRPNTPELFQKLVRSLTKLSVSSYDSILEETVKICDDQKTARKFYFDALAMTNTEESTKFITSLLLERKVTDFDMNTWLTYLSLIRSKPTEVHVTSMARLIKVYSDNKNVLFAASSIVKKYCQDADCLERQNDASSIVQKLFSKLPKDGVSKAKQNSKEEKELVIVLKAIGNIGFWSKAIDGSERLAECALSQQNRILIRSFALTALADVSYNGALMIQLENLMSDLKVDTELRIKAYLIAMKRPSSTIVSRIKRILNSEKSNQMGSFMWTHLTNIKETDDPTMREIRQILQTTDPNIAKEFDLEKLKFSRNYEKTLFSQRLNMGSKIEANLMFSEKSFAPKFASINMTTFLFGNAYNLFQMDGRIDGLEKMVDLFIGNAEDKKKSLTEENKYLTVLKNIEASVGVKLFDAQVAFLQYDTATFNDVKSALNLKNIMKLLGKGVTYNTEKYVQLIDTSFTIPTAIGLPLTFKIDASAALKVDMKVNMNLPKSLFSEALVLKNLMKPSAAINMNAYSSIQSPFGEYGVKFSGNLHTSTDIQLDAKASYRSELTFEIRMDKQKQELFNVRTETHLVRRSISYKVESSPENRIRRKFCTGSIISTAFGSRVCGDFEYQGITPGTPMLLTAVNGAFYVEKTDTQTGYKFSIVKDTNTWSDNKYELTLNFDTPGSLINRKIVNNLEISTDVNNRKLLLTLINPMFDSSVMLRLNENNVPEGYVKLNDKKVFEVKTKESIINERELTHQLELYVPSLIKQIIDLRIQAKTVSESERKYSMQMTNLYEKPISLQLSLKRIMENLFGSLEKENTYAIEGTYSIKEIEGSVNMKYFVEGKRQFVDLRAEHVSDMTNKHEVLFRHLFLMTEDTDFVKLSAKNSLIYRKNGIDRLGYKFKQMLEMKQRSFSFKTDVMSMGNMFTQRRLALENVYSKSESSGIAYEVLSSLDYSSNNNYRTGYNFAFTRKENHKGSLFLSINQDEIVEVDYELPVALKNMRASLSGKIMKKDVAVKQEILLIDNLLVSNTHLKYVTSDLILAGQVKWDDSLNHQINLKLEGSVMPYLEVNLKMKSTDANQLTGIGEITYGKNTIPYTAQLDVVYKQKYGVFFEAANAQLSLQRQNEQLVIKTENAFNPFHLMNRIEVTYNEKTWKYAIEVLNDVENSYSGTLKKLELSYATPYVARGVEASLKKNGGYLVTEAALHLSEDRKWKVAYVLDINDGWTEKGLKTKFSVSTPWKNYENLEVKLSALGQLTYRNIKFEYLWAQGKRVFLDLTFHPRGWFDFSSTFKLTTPFSRLSYAAMHTKFQLTDKNLQSEFLFDLGPPTLQKLLISFSAEDESDSYSTIYSSKLQVDLPNRKNFGFNFKHAATFDSADTNAKIFWTGDKIITFANKYSLSVDQSEFLFNSNVKLETPFQIFKSGKVAVNVRGLRDSYNGNIRISSSQDEIFWTSFSAESGSHLKADIRTFNAPDNYALEITRQNDFTYKLQLLRNSKDIFVSTLTHSQYKIGLSVKTPFYELQEFDVQLINKWSYKFISMKYLSQNQRTNVLKGSMKVTEKNVYEADLSSDILYVVDLKAQFVSKDSYVSGNVAWMDEKVITFENLGSANEMSLFVKGVLEFTGHNKYSFSKHSLKLFFLPHEASLIIKNTKSSDSKDVDLSLTYGLQNLLINGKSEIKSGFISKQANIQSNMFTFINFKSIKLGMNIRQSMGGMIEVFVNDVGGKLEGIFSKSEMKILLNWTNNRPLELIVHYALDDNTVPRKLQAVLNYYGTKVGADVEFVNDARSKVFKFQVNTPMMALQELRFHVVNNDVEKLFDVGVKNFNKAIRLSNRLSAKEVSSIFVCDYSPQYSYEFMLSHARQFQDNSFYFNINNARIFKGILSYSVLKVNVELQTISKWMENVKFVYTFTPYVDLNNNFNIDILSNKISYELSTFFTVEPFALKFQLQQDGEKLYKFDLLRNEGITLNLETQRKAFAYVIGFYGAHYNGFYISAANSAKDSVLFQVKYSTELFTAVFHKDLINYFIEGSPAKTNAMLNIKMTRNLLIADATFPGILENTANLKIEREALTNSFRAKLFINEDRLCLNGDLNISPITRSSLAVISCRATQRIFESVKMLYEPRKYLSFDFTSGPKILQLRLSPQLMKFQMKGISTLIGDLESELSSSETVKFFKLSSVKFLKKPIFVRISKRKQAYFFEIDSEFKYFNNLKLEVDAYSGFGYKCKFEHQDLGVCEFHLKCKEDEMNVGRCNFQLKSSNLENVIKIVSQMKRNKITQKLSYFQAELYSDSKVLAYFEMGRKNNEIQCPLTKFNFLLNDYNVKWDLSENSASFFYSSPTWKEKPLEVSLKKSLDNAFYFYAKGLRIGQTTAKLSLNDLVAELTHDSELVQEPIKFLFSHQRQSANTELLLSMYAYNLNIKSQGFTRTVIDLNNKRIFILKTQQKSFYMKVGELFQMYLQNLAPWDEPEAYTDVTQYALKMTWKQSRLTNNLEVQVTLPSNNEVITSSLRVQLSSNEIEASLNVPYWTVLKDVAFSLKKAEGKVWIEGKAINEVFRVNLQMDDKLMVFIKHNEQIQLNLLIEKYRLLLTVPKLNIQDFEVIAEIEPRENYKLSVKHNEQRVASALITNNEILLSYFVSNEKVCQLKLKAEALTRGKSDLSATFECNGKMLSLSWQHDAALFVHDLLFENQLIDSVPRNIRSKSYLTNGATSFEYVLNVNNIQALKIIYEHMTSAQLEVGDALQVQVAKREFSLKWQNPETGKELSVAAKLQYKGYLHYEYNVEMNKKLYFGTMQVSEQNEVYELLMNLKEETKEVVYIKAMADVSSLPKLKLNLAVKHMDKEVISIDGNLKLSLRASFITANAKIFDYRYESVIVSDLSDISKATLKLVSYQPNGERVEYNLSFMHRVLIDNSEIVIETNAQIFDESLHFKFETDRRKTFSVNLLTPLDYLNFNVRGKVEATDFSSELEINIESMTYGRYTVKSEVTQSNDEKTVRTSVIDESANKEIFKQNFELSLLPEQKLNALLFTKIDLTNFKHESKFQGKLVLLNEAYHLNMVCQPSKTVIYEYYGKFQMTRQLVMESTVNVNNYKVTGSVNLKKNLLNLDFAYLIDDKASEAIKFSIYWSKYLRSFHNSFLIMSDRISHGYAFTVEDYSLQQLEVFSPRIAFYKVGFRSENVADIDNNNDITKKYNIYLGMSQHPIFAINSNLKELELRLTNPFAKKREDSVIRPVTSYTGFHFENTLNFSFRKNKLTITTDIEGYEIIEITFLPMKAVDDVKYKFSLEVSVPKQGYNEIFIAKYSESEAMERSFSLISKSKMFSFIAKSKFNSNEAKLFLSLSANNIDYLFLKYNRLVSKGKLSLSTTFKSYYVVNSSVFKFNLNFDLSASTSPKTLSTKFTMNKENIFDLRLKLGGMLKKNILALKIKKDIILRITADIQSNQLLVINFQNKAENVKHFFKVTRKDFVFKVTFTYPSKNTIVIEMLGEGTFKATLNKEITVTLTLLQKYKKTTLKLTSNHPSFKKFYLKFDKSRGKKVFLKIDMECIFFTLQGNYKRIGWKKINAEGDIKVEGEKVFDFKYDNDMKTKIGEVDVTAGSMSLKVKRTGDVLNHEFDLVIKKDTDKKIMTLKHTFDAGQMYLNLNAKVWFKDQMLEENIVFKPEEGEYKYHLEYSKNEKVLKYFRVGLEVMKNYFYLESSNPSLQNLKISILSNGDMSSILNDKSWFKVSYNEKGFVLTSNSESVKKFAVEVDMKDYSYVNVFLNDYYWKMDIIVKADTSYEFKLNANYPKEMNGEGKLTLNMISDNKNEITLNVMKYEAKLVQEYFTDNADVENLKLSLTSNIDMAKNVDLVFKRKLAFNKYLLAVEYDRMQKTGYLKFNFDFESTLKKTTLDMYFDSSLKFLSSFELTVRNDIEGETINQNLILKVDNQDVLLSESVATNSENKMNITQKWSIFYKGEILMSSNDVFYYEYVEKTDDVMFSILHERLQPIPYPYKKIILSSKGSYSYSRQELDMEVYYGISTKDFKRARVLKSASMVQLAYEDADKNIFLVEKNYDKDTTTVDVPLINSPYNVLYSRNKTEYTGELHLASKSVMGSSSDYKYENTFRIAIQGNSIKLTTDIPGYTKIDITYILSPLNSRKQEAKVKVVIPDSGLTMDIDISYEKLDNGFELKALTNSIGTYSTTLKITEDSTKVRNVLFTVSEAEQLEILMIKYRREMKPKGLLITCVWSGSYISGEGLFKFDIDTKDNGFYLSSVLKAQSTNIYKVEVMLPMKLAEHVISVNVMDDYTFNTVFNILSKQIFELRFGAKSYGLSHSLLVSNGEGPQQSFLIETTFPQKMEIRVSLLGEGEYEINSGDFKFTVKITSRYGLTKYSVISNHPFLNSLSYTYNTRKRGKVVVAFELRNLIGTTKVDFVNEMFKEIKLEASTVDNEGQSLMEFEYENNLEENTGEIKGFLMGYKLVVERSGTSSKHSFSFVLSHFVLGDIINLSHKFELYRVVYFDLKLSNANEKYNLLLNLNNQEELYKAFYEYYLQNELKNYLRVGYVERRFFIETSSPYLKALTVSMNTNNEIETNINGRDWIKLNMSRESIKITSSYTALQKLYVAYNLYGDYPFFTVEYNDYYWRVTSSSDEKIELRTNYPEEMTGLVTFKRLNQYTKEIKFTISKYQGSLIVTQKAGSMSLMFISNIENIKSISADLTYSLSDAKKTISLKYDRMQKLGYLNLNLEFGYTGMEYDAAFSKFSYSSSLKMLKDIELSFSYDMKQAYSRSFNYDMSLLYDKVEILLFKSESSAKELNGNTLYNSTILTQIGSTENVFYKSKENLIVEVNAERISAAFSYDLLNPTKVPMKQFALTVDGYFNRKDKSFKGGLYYGISSKEFTRAQIVKSTSALKLFYDDNENTKFKLEQNFDSNEAFLSTSYSSKNVLSSIANVRDFVYENTFTIKLKRNGITLFTDVDGYRKILIEYTKEENEGNKFKINIKIPEAEIDVDATMSMKLLDNGIDIAIEAPTRDATYKMTFKTEIDLGANSQLNFAFTSNNDAILKLDVVREKVPGTSLKYEIAVESSNTEYKKVFLQFEAKYGKEKSFSGLLKVDEMEMLKIEANFDPKTTSKLFISLFQDSELEASFSLTTKDLLLVKVSKKSTDMSHYLNIIRSDGVSFTAELSYPQLNTLSFKMLDEGNYKITINNKQEINISIKQKYQKNTLTVTYEDYKLYVKYDTRRKKVKIDGYLTKGKEMKLTVNYVRQPRKRIDLTAILKENGRQTFSLSYKNNMKKKTGKVSIKSNWLTLNVDRSGNARKHDFKLKLNIKPLQTKVKIDYSLNAKKNLVKFYTDVKVMDIKVKQKLALGEKKLFFSVDVFQGTKNIRYIKLDINKGQFVFKSSHLIPDILMLTEMLTGTPQNYIEDDWLMVTIKSGKIFQIKTNRPEFEHFCIMMNKKDISKILFNEYYVNFKKISKLNFEVETNYPEKMSGEMKLCISEECEYVVSISFPNKFLKVKKTVINNGYKFSLTSNIENMETIDLSVAMDQSKFAELKYDRMNGKGFLNLKYSMEQLAKKQYLMAMSYSSSLKLLKPIDMTLKFSNDKEVGSESIMELTYGDNFSLREVNIMKYEKDLYIYERTTEIKLRGEIVYKQSTNLTYVYRYDKVLDFKLNYNHINPYSYLYKELRFDMEHKVDYSKMEGEIVVYYGVSSKRLKKVKVLKSASSLQMSTEDNNLINILLRNENQRKILSVTTPLVGYEEPLKVYFHCKQNYLATQLETPFETLRALQFEYQKSKKSNQLTNKLFFKVNDVEYVKLFTKVGNEIEITIEKPLRLTVNAKKVNNEVQFLAKDNSQENAYVMVKVNTVDSYIYYEQYKKEFYLQLHQDVIAAIYKRESSLRHKWGFKLTPKKLSVFTPASDIELTEDLEQFVLTLNKDIVYRLKYRLVQTADENKFIYELYLPNRSRPMILAMSMPTTKTSRMKEYILELSVSENSEDNILIRYTMLGVLDNKKLSITQKSTKSEAILAWSRENPMNLKLVLKNQNLPKDKVYSWHYNATYLKGVKEELSVLQLDDLELRLQKNSGESEINEKVQLKNSNTNEIIVSYSTLAKTETSKNRKSFLFTIRNDLIEEERVVLGFESELLSPRILNTKLYYDYSYQLFQGVTEQRNVYKKLSDHIENTLMKDLATVSSDVLKTYKEFFTDLSPIWNAFAANKRFVNDLYKEDALFIQTFYKCVASLANKLNDYANSTAQWFFNTFENVINSIRRCIVYMRYLKMQIRRTVKAIIADISSFTADIVFGLSKCTLYVTESVIRFIQQNRILPIRHVVKPFASLYRLGLISTRNSMNSLEYSLSNAKLESLLKKMLSNAVTLIDNHLRAMQPFYKERLAELSMKYDQASPNRKALFGLLQDSISGMNWFIESLRTDETLNDLIYQEYTALLSYVRRQSRRRWLQKYNLDKYHVKYEKTLTGKQWEVQVYLPLYQRIAVMPQLPPPKTNFFRTLYRNIQMARMYGLSFPRLISPKRNCYFFKEIASKSKTSVITFDGTAVKLPGREDVILAKYSNKWEIKTIDNQRNIQIQLDDDVIKISNSGELKINDRAISAGYYSTKFYFKVKNNQIKIGSRDYKFKIVYDYSLNVLTLKASRLYHGKLSGEFGNMDGENYNEIKRNVEFTISPKYKDDCSYLFKSPFSTLSSCFNTINVEPFLSLCSDKPNEALKMYKLQCKMMGISMDYSQIKKFQ